MNKNRYFLFINVLMTIIFIGYLSSCSNDEVITNNIILSIENNNLDDLERYLSKKKYSSESDKENMLDDALDLAIKNNSIEVIEILLKYGANQNKIINNKEKDSLLSWAIRAKNNELIKELLKKDADVNYIDNDGFSVFLLAIIYLPEDDLFQFLNHNLNLSYEKKNQGTTYFTKLMNQGYYKFLKYIICDPKLSKSLFEDEALSLRLIYSWNDGAKVIADLLLEKGLKLDNQKYPLIQEAVSDMNYEAVEWLLDHGISPIFKYSDPLGQDVFNEGTPLEVARFTLSRIRRFSDEDYLEESIKKMDQITKLLESRIELLKLQ